MNNGFKLSNQQILLTMLFAGIMTAFLSFLIEFSEGESNWFASWLMNFSTEVLGALLTFLLFDRIIGRQNTKQLLIHQMGSQINHEAQRAVELLRAEGWLTDGSLNLKMFQGADLKDCDLSNGKLIGADFSRANLTRAKLTGAKMSGTSLLETDLIRTTMINTEFDKANVRDSTLREASMSFANLNDAKIVNCDLQDVTAFCSTCFQTDFTGSNLIGVDFTNANLTSAVFDNAIFDETTILPDGQNWQVETVLAVFTNPNHPDYWAINKNMELSTRE